MAIEIYQAQNTRLHYNFPHLAVNKLTEISNNISKGPVSQFVYQGNDRIVVEKYILSKKFELPFLSIPPDFFPQITIVAKNASPSCAGFKYTHFFTTALKISKFKNRAFRVSITHKKNSLK